MARALLVVDLATAALSAVCLGLTIGTRAFHRLPAVYIFSTLGLVAPGFGVGAACLVLRSAARAHVSATANRREHATRMRRASHLAPHTSRLLALQPCVPRGCNHIGPGCSPTCPRCNPTYYRLQPDAPQAAAPTCHRLASGMLALHVLLVGAAFVGLPVSAATGYGQEMAAYIVTAVACGVCAAVGLALLVLVTQAATLGAGGCNPRSWRLQP